MRYALLALFLVAVLLVSLAGQRGKIHPDEALRLFPDMDEQEILRPQAASEVFVDGLADRRPVDGTIPMGYTIHEAQKLAADLEFTGAAETGYYWTGRQGDWYGDGLPEELELENGEASALARRGRQRFEIHCAICHGVAGDGLGVASGSTVAGRVPAVADLRLPLYRVGTYPDGRLFDVISHGKGNMVGYADKITVRDRWAIVAYVRVLQERENPDSFVPEVRERLTAPEETETAPEDGETAQEDGETAQEDGETAEGNAAATGESAPTEATEDSSPSDEVDSAPAAGHAPTEGGEGGQPAADGSDDGSTPPPGQPGLPDQATGAEPS